jgi:hypothetical protein
MFISSSVSEAYLLSYPMGTEAIFPKLKAAEACADDSHPSCAEIKYMWSSTSTPPYVFMAQ